jgi:hypothetical protein
MDMTTTTTPSPPAKPVGDMSTDELREFRAEVVASGDSLLEEYRASGTLTPEATVRFEQVERLVHRIDNRLELDGRSANLEDPRFAPLFAAAATEGRETPFRPPGVLPMPAFSGEQYTAFHADVLAGRPAQIETFTVTAPPMAVIPGQRLPPPPFPTEPTRIADVLPTDLSVLTPKVTFYTTTTAASAATAIAEGTDKPESDPDWTATTIDIRKIAHYVDVSTEALDDYAAFRAVVSAEMSSGLIVAENAQLASGNGTAPNIRGLLNATGIVTYAPSSAEPRYLSIRTAIRNLRKGAGFATPNVILIHPDDEQIFDLTNASSAGLHALPDMNGTPTPGPWGLTEIITTGVPSGTALVMDTRRAAVLYVRQPPTLISDPYSQSKSNMVRVICEERIGLAILNPNCLCKITFNGTA